MANAPLNPIPATDVFAGSGNYPLNLRQYDPVTTQGPLLNRRINALADELFDEDLNVRVIDVVENAGGALSCSHHDYYNTDHTTPLRDLIRRTENPRMRIISIHQRGSITPLQITRELMLQILTRYQVVPEFLNVLFSFGTDPHVAESGNSNVAIVGSASGTQQTCYQLRYAEENYRSKKTPWSVRQTGVYHQHDTASKFDLWILLNPSTDCVVETQLEALESPASSIALSRLRDDPSQFHSLICASYIQNWRWYLRHLGELFEQKNDPAFALDHMRATALVLSFDSVRGLRDLHDDVIALSAHCSGDLKIVDTLKNKLSQQESLEPYSTLLVGYIESLTVLQNRIRNTIDLIAYALDIKNQEEASDLNKHLYRLTSENVDDNATVKLITVVSLVYLPGSFVGTLYGANFFAFDATTKRFLFARKDFWIWAVTWIGLTLLTFLAYGLFVHRHKNRPDRKDGPVVFQRTFKISEP